MVCFKCLTLQFATNNMYYTLRTDWGLILVITYNYASNCSLLYLNTDLKTVQIWVGTCHHCIYQN